MKHPWIVTVELELELVPVAQAAYEAFRQMELHAKPKSAPLTWHYLPTHTRVAWEEAVITALRKVTNTTLEVGDGMESAAGSR